MKPYHWERENRGKETGEFLPGVENQSPIRKPNICSKPKSKNPSEPRHHSIEHFPCGIYFGSKEDPSHETDPSETDPISETHPIRTHLRDRAQYYKGCYPKI